MNKQWRVIKPHDRYVAIDFETDQHVFFRAFTQSEAVAWIMEAEAKRRDRIETIKATVGAAFFVLVFCVVIGLAGYLPP